MTLDPQLLEILVCPNDRGEVDYLEAEASGAVVRAVDAGGIDALVLDGEAWPAGGLGVCRQLKNEIDPCPPILVVLARDADRWLGKWSMADAVLVTPLGTSTKSVPR